jgi:hypothetical protein
MHGLQLKFCIRPKKWCDRASGNTGDKLCTADLLRQCMNQASKWYYDFDYIRTEINLIILTAVLWKLIALFDCIRTINLLILIALELKLT